MGLNKLIVLVFIEICQVCHISLVVLAWQLFPWSQVKWGYFVMTQIICLKVSCNFGPMVNFLRIEDCSWKICWPLSDKKISLFLFVLKFIINFGFQRCILVETIIMTFFALVIDIYIECWIPFKWWSLKSRLFPLSLEKSQVLDKSGF